MLVSRVVRERRFSLVSGVVSARPVGEQRSRSDSDQRLWVWLQPALHCSGPPLLRTSTFGPSDLEQHRHREMEQTLFPMFPSYQVTNGIIQRSATSAGAVALFYRPVMRSPALGGVIEARLLTLKCFGDSTEPLLCRNSVEKAPI